MARVFASWSHRDRAAMTVLRETAEQLGSIVVCEEIEERNDWRAIAFRNIHASDCVVVILTSNSEKSSQCEEEVSIATNLGKPILIWTPATRLLTPPWAVGAQRLSDDVINAEQAVVELSARLGA